MKYFINTIPCRRASDIIHTITEPEKVLNKRFPFFKEYSNNTKFNPSWIFRGAASDAYDLKPSAMRENFQLKPSQKNIGLRDNISSEKNQRKISELRLVSEFYKNCIQAGLRVPVFPQDIHESLVKLDVENLLNWTHGNNGTWPKLELFEIFSLAQHYGIPTRLLDWTRNPFVAAFFAAKDAEKDKKGNLAIWLLSSIFAQEFGHVIKLKLIEPPTFGNANLILQQGVFTLLDDSQDEKCLASLYSNLIAKNPDSNKYPPIFKLTLPNSQAPNLLILLENIGIYSSRIFNGYEGAAKFQK